MIDTAASTITPLNTGGYTSFGRLAVTGAGLTDPEGELTVVTVAGSATKAQAVVMLQVRWGGGDACGWEPSRLISMETHMPYSAAWVREMMG